MSMGHERANYRANCALSLHYRCTLRSRKAGKFEQLFCHKSGTHCL